MCSRSMSGGAGCFDMGGEYTELRYRDLDLSGPDEFLPSPSSTGRHIRPSAHPPLTWLLDSTPTTARRPERLCCEKGASVPGGAVPSELLVLASCAGPCGARRLRPDPVQEHALRRSSGRTLPALGSSGATITFDFSD